MTTAQSCEPPVYAVKHTSSTDEDIVAQALRILSARVRTGPIFDSPVSIKDYLRLYFAEASQQGREEFAVLFLDSQHRLIEARTLFRGTLTQTSVYPREVVRESILLNSAAVVLAHNHPSGMAEPSRADEYLTQTLKSSLQLVDVRVLDHFVVGNSVVSFAERGLI